VGRPADVYGRRAILFVLAILYFLSGVGCATATSWEAFTISRFLGGLAVGGTSVVSPMYIAELSPAKYRGRLVAITQLNIVFGILLAYCSNYLISSMAGSLPGDLQYRWMFGVQAIPAAAFFFLLFFTPQSPRWLLARQRVDAARAVLEKYGADSDRLEDEIEEIQASLDMAHHSLHEPFYCRKYTKPILLAMAMGAFNQLSGINAVLYYTPAIFKMAGAKVESALLQSVIVGAMMLLFTIVALAVIDHVGRRKLMLLGSLGYLLGLGGVTYAFYVGGQGKLLLASLLVFTAAHGFGQGAVIWVFISEIFPNRVRARGQALGSFTVWVVNAAISWTFPVIAASAGWMAFGFYAFCMVLQLVWVICVMPETKGVSLEQIQKRLGID